MRKKYLFLILTIFLSLLFMCDDVEAYIKNTNTEIECIYGNGIVVSLSYDAKQKKHTVYIRDYPVQKTVNIEGEPVTNISFFNDNHAIDRLKTLTCPSEIRFWKAWEYTNGDKDEKTYRGVYAFDWCSNKSSGCSGGDPTITEALKTTKTTGWWIFSGEEQTGGTDTVNGNGLLGNSSPEGRIPLVGERLYIVDQISSDGYHHTYKLVTNSKDEQAIGSNKYMQVYSYYGGNSTAYQIGGTITSNPNGKDSKIYHAKYLCVSESKIVTDASRGDTGKKIVGIRHEVEASTEKGKCPAGYQKYERTTEVCKIKTGTNRESFCDKYSNTAFVLIDIIKIMQILVPGLVIVLTGIEIGRIVVAGNIEEEIPKRKKSMIIRFIVMITFLFLPVITQLIISLAEGVDILDVSCLFNDGQAVVNDPLSEKNCVDLTKTEEK